MSAESSVKRHLTPINAHQQKSVPLLRRPRPPKQTKTKLSNSNASSETTSKSEDGAANHTQDCTFVHPTPYTADAYNDSTFTTYPRGTSLLPPGKVLRSNHQTRFVEESQTEQVEFTLNDFQLSAEALHQVMPNKLRGAVISRQNYLKLTSWFAANVPKQKAINTVNLEGKCIHPFMQTIPSFFCLSSTVAYCWVMCVISVLPSSGSWSSRWEETYAPNVTWWATCTLHLAESLQLALCKLTVFTCEQVSFCND